MKTADVIRVFVVVETVTIDIELEDFTEYLTVMGERYPIFSSTCLIDQTIERYHFLKTLPVGFQEPRVMYTCMYACRYNCIHVCMRPSVVGS